MGTLISVHIAKGSNGEKEEVFQLKNLERTKISLSFMCIYIFLSVYNRVKFGDQTKLLFHLT